MDDEHVRQPVRWYGIVVFGLVTGSVIFVLDSIGWTNEPVTFGNFVGDVAFGTLVGVGIYNGPRVAGKWRRFRHR